MPLLNVPTSYLKKRLTRAQRYALEVRTQFKQHVATALIAAFGFLIAVSWKDFVVKLFENTIKPNIVLSYPYLPELLTAIVTTFFAVIGILIVTRWQKKEEKVI